MVDGAVKRESDEFMRTQAFQWYPRICDVLLASRRTVVKAP